MNSIVSVTIRYKEKGASTWSGTTTIVNGIANIIYQDLLAMSANYDLEVTVKDTFNLSTTSNYTLSSAQRMFDFRNDRAAFGRVAGATKTFILPDDWTTNVDADLLDGNHASAFAAATHEHSAADITSGTLPVERGGTGVTTTKEIALLSYPIGAIYMSLTDTSPATLFGGTWAAIDAGRFLVAAGTGYTAGGTGGATTHAHTQAAHAHTTTAVALTVAQLPSHSHVYKDGRYGSTNDSVGSHLKLVNYTPGSHVANTTSSAGSGSTHGHGNTGNATPTINAASSLPPYYAVYMWRRTA